MLLRAFYEAVNQVYIELDTDYHLFVEDIYNWGLNAFNGHSGSFKQSYSDEQGKPI